MQRRIILLGLLGFLQTGSVDGTGDNLYEGVPGDNVTIPCGRVQGDENVLATLWYKNDFLLASMTPNGEVRYADTSYEDNMAITHEHSLVLANVQVGDTGNYSCRVFVENSSTSSIIDRDVTRVLVVQVVSQGPEIIAEIPPEVRRQGETARFVCSVANNGGSVVMWTFMDGSLIVSQDEVPPGLSHKFKVDVTTGGHITNVTLSVLSLVEADAGKYKCVLRVPGVPSSHWPSKTTFLTVSVPPSIQLSGSTDQQVVDEGGATHLTCLAHGVPSPNITWSRLDGQFLDSGHALFRAARLPITNARFEDSGLYRCVADNSINPPATHVSELAVATVPRVRAVETRVGQIQNRRRHATLGCIVEGYPSPIVEWSRIYFGTRETLPHDDKFGMDIRTLAGRFLMTKKRLYTLTVHNVQANDYRNYTCTARNNKGSAQAVFTLYDLEDPQFTTVTP